MEESKVNSNEKMYKKIYLKTKINMILFSIVFIGAINWGATALGYNLVELLNKYINTSFNVNYPIDKIIYIIVALSAIWLATKKTTWLPFLGTGIMPSGLVPIRKPAGANKKVAIKTYPNAKIVYWSAYKKGEETNVVDAYANYDNSGVVMADANGNTTLEIIEGSGYTVPSGRVIPRHIHYRTIGTPDGMMGKVQTVNY
jgi:uncharacterized membrane protein YuzA (DUF378 family)